MNFVKFDAGRKLILRHVIYRQIENYRLEWDQHKFSELYEHFTVKKNSQLGTPYNLPTAQKKARVDWSREIVKNTKAVLQNTSMMTGDDPASEQQSAVVVFKDEPNPTKAVRARSTSKEMVAYFFFFCKSWTYRNRTT